MEVTHSVVLSTKAGEEEWQTFIDGVSLSASLLINILQLKYKHQKRIRVSPKVIIIKEKAMDVEEEEAASTIRDWAPLPAHVDYELVVMVHYARGWPITSLLVIRHASPFILFTPVDSNFMNENVGATHLIHNNHYILGLDNGYAVFDFLTRLFKDGVEAMLTRSVLYPPNTCPQSQKNAAALIVADLERPRRIKERIVTLYREINQLLRYHTDANAITDDMRRIVERKKQQLYVWVEYVLREISTEPPTDVGEVEATRFFPLPVLQQKEDAMEEGREEEQQRPANDLFREMVKLIDFMTQVVDVGEREHSDLTELKVSEERIFRVPEIRRHIEHLRFRLLNLVDVLNQPVIDTLRAHQLRFTQTDYERLSDDKLISYNVMAALLKPTLHQDLALFGPRDADANAGVFNLRKLENKKLIFWVIEGTLPDSYALLVVHRRKNGTTRRITYLRADDTLEMARLQSVGDSLMQKMGLTSFLRQLVTAPNNLTSLKEPYFSSWYITLIIKALNSQYSADSSIEDWTTRVAPILQIGVRELFDQIEPLTIIVRRRILSLLFDVTPEPVLITDRPLLSAVADLARLQFCNQFIDDGPLQDLINRLPTKPHIRILETTYWGGTITEPNIQVRPLRVFNDPSVDLVLLAVNEENDHWSLSIIDLALRRVSYYTSLDESRKLKRGEKKYYFERLFIEHIRSFLSIQTPGAVYEIERLVDPDIQPGSSVDCGLYVVNKINQLVLNRSATNRETRATASLYLRKRFIALLQSKGWKVFLRDIMERYIDATEEFIWRTIKDLDAYRQTYSEELFLNIMRPANLYTTKSIDEVATQLDCSYFYSMSNDKILVLLSTLFEKTLQSLTKKRSGLGNIEPRTETKLRKCIRTPEAIDELFQRVLSLKERHEPLSRQEFKQKYGEKLLSLSKNLVDEMWSEAFLNALLDALFDEPGDARVERLEKVINTYIICKEDVVKCFYCKIET